TATTTAAVTTPLKASPYPKERIGQHRTSESDMPAKRGSSAIELHLDWRAALERLVDDAGALGELEQLVELVLRRGAVHLEAQADGRKTDRRIFGDPERAAEVEIALGADLSGLERNLERGRDRLERDAGAGDQRLEQHVAGTKFETGAARCGVQPSDRERTPRFHLASDVRVVERALGLQGDEGRLRVAFVALLERRLHGAQRSGIHWKSPLRTAEHRRQRRGKRKPRPFPAMRCASPPQAAAGRCARLDLLGHDHRAIERTVERRQHAALDEIEGGGLAVARARQFAG